MKYDVAGIGSPLFDFIIPVEDSVLLEMNLQKGVMQLIDADRSKDIMDRLRETTPKMAPGGSSANTLAGVAALGGSAVFIGSVGNDGHAAIYEQSTDDAGVVPRLSRIEGLTGHTITFITPDSERTFATHLGASLRFRKEHVFKEDIRHSAILHIEGYQLEDPEIREAVLHAVDIAKRHGRLVSIDLNDAALIRRNLEHFQEFVRDSADIVFVNEEEIKAFTGKEREEGLEAIDTAYAILKIGAGGSVIQHEGALIHIPAYETRVVNTNGAGDMYAAGILFGITHDIPLEKAGMIASYAAACIVADEPARLTKDIKRDVQRIIEGEPDELQST